MGLPVAKLGSIATGTAATPPLMIPTQDTGTLTVGCEPTVLVGGQPIAVLQSGGTTTTKGVDFEIITIVGTGMVLAGKKQVATQNAICQQKQSALPSTFSGTISQNCDITVLVG